MTSELSGYEMNAERLQLEIENRRRQDRKRAFCQGVLDVVECSFSAVLAVVVGLVCAFLILTLCCGCIFMFRELVRLV